MSRKTAQVTVGMEQPAVVARETTKARDSARASAQKGTKQEVPARRQQTAATDKKSTKRSRPDGASAPKATKVQTILALLGQPGGTTVAAIMQATGWQQHSVRAFLAGTVRKKLGLTLVSEKVDDQRVYRVAAEKSAKSRSATGAAAPAPTAG